MWRIVFVILAGLALLTVLTLGFRGTESTRPPLEFFSDMADQPKYKPQSGSGLYADGRSQRPPVEHAVPWGRHPNTPDQDFLVKDEDLFELQTVPVPVDRDLLERGRAQFDIYCAVCHARTGDGNGITTQYGMLNPPSYHSERLRDMPDGEVYRIITLGKGLMGSYADKVSRADRWAIVAYIRALQRAFHATLEDVSETRRRELQAENP